MLQGQKNVFLYVSVKRTKIFLCTFGIIMSTKVPIYYYSSFLSRLDKLKEYKNYSSTLAFYWFLFKAVVVTRCFIFCLPLLLYQCYLILWNILEDRQKGNLPYPICMEIGFHKAPNILSFYTLISLIFLTTTYHKLASASESQSGAKLRSLSLSLHVLKIDIGLDRKFYHQHLAK